jgi:hypothetical protein
MTVLRLVAITAVCAGVGLAIHAAIPGEFRPDSTFRGSSLSGWHQLGNVTWKASNGVITAAPASSGGGWLILDQTLQDTYAFASFRATAGAQAGVMVRSHKTAAGGLQGLLISLADGDLACYKVTLDAQGKELEREKLAGPAGRGGGGGTGGGRNQGPGATASGPPGGTAAGSRGGGGGADGERLLPHSTRTTGMKWRF